MNEKLQLFSKTFYQNRAVLNARRFSFFSTVVIFFIVVIMSSFPLYYARTSLTGEELLERFPTINDAFSELYESEQPIRINEQADLEVYGEVTVDRVGDYNLYFEYIDDESENVIIFDKYGIKIVYINPDTEVVHKITGDYNLLIGTDFAKIKSEKPDDITLEAYYEATTKSILHSIHYSTLTRDFVQVTLVQGAQFLMFVLVIGALLLVNNISKSTGRLSYIKSIKVTIIAGLTPALITALIGLFNQSIGSIAFTVLYAIRLVFVYRILTREGLDVDSI